MSSFRIMDTKFRILKGGKIGLAMSIAMIGGMLSLGSVSAQADTTTVLSSGGSSTPGLFDQGSTSSSPGWDPSPGYHSGDFSGYSLVDFNIQTQNIDALGITTTFNVNQTGGDANWSYTTINDNSILLNSGRNITGKTLADGGTYAGVYSQNNVYTNGDETNWNYSYFGSISTLNVQGNNVIDGQVGLNFYNWDTSVAPGTQYLAQNDMLGTINLNGYDVTFGNAVFADNIFVNSGTNNTINNDYSFYGEVYSNLTFNQAASVLLNGGLHAYSENLGGTLQSTSGNLNYNGYNSIVTLGANQTITGNVMTSGVNGTLIFQGAGTVQGDVVPVANNSLEEVRANGIGNVLFTNTNAAEVDHVNYQAAALIGFNGGLNLSIDDSTDSVNTVTFNNHDGVLQINNGDLKGIEGQAVVTTTSNNKGTVTMVSGSQVITGNIGSSGHAIKTLNIGGDASGGLAGNIGTSFSVTTANGDIYAQNTVLNNNGTTNGSELSMASGYDLYSTVTTADANVGTLKLLGGDQIVTGNVGLTGTRLAQVDSGANGAISNFGTSLAQTDVFAVTVQNTGTGTTNFSRDVGATTINVSNGISNFTDDVTATTTNIGTGTGNFNTNDEGVTVSDIAFTGTGIANLHTGLTGHINFAGNNANVNVWQNQSIVGNIATATTNNTGIVNFKGNGTLDGTVGASNMGISALNINTDNTSDTPLSAEVTVTGHVYANNINLNDGTLRVAVGKNLIDTEVARTTFITTTGAAGPEASGELFLMGGNQLIDGQVGTAAHKISGVYTNMSESGTTTFNEKVYISQLTNGGYWSDVAKTGHAIFNEMAFIDNLVAGTASGGVIDLNGINADNTNASGMIGQLLLNNTSTTVNIGDNVNLTVIDLGDENAPDGVAFTYANNATMHFVGDSTVIGQVGGGNDYDNSTFAEIYAGANGKTVTFKDDVHVLEGSLNPATFYVSGTGTVNFEGNLYGDLVYNADGVVNVSNGKSILVNTVPVAVTTITDGTGTLNYLGSTTLDTDIGTSAAMLKSVTFNSASNNVTQNIGYDVYADTVTIGGVSGTTAISLVDVTGTYDYAGATTIKEYIGGTAANITSNVTLGGNLVIANSTSAINFGTSHVTVGMNHDGITPGAFTTSNGAMSFTVNTQDITGADEAISTSAGSGLVTTTALNMSGNEKIHINYVGSLANNGTYTLINGTSGTSVDNTLNTAIVGSYNQNENGNVSDNSFSIDTRIATNNAGDLTVYSDRTANASYTADELYVQKSETVGHFSNNAAMTLASISADGSQTGDMIEVIQKLELDSFGYGNNQENLAVQVQKLAPIVNTSFAQTSIGATKLVTDTVGSRLSDVRGLSSGEAVKDKGVWAKVTGSTASQDKVGQYDGYNLSSGGVVFGIDKELNNGTIIGLAAGYTNTKTEQDDFRDGDKSTTNSYQLAAYASKTYDKAYVDGSLSYTRHNTDGERSTAIDRVASYDVDANQLSAKINGGYNFMLENKVALTPFASLEYSTIKQDAYKETGAGAINLSVDDVTVNRGAAGLGVKISKEIKTEKNTYIPEFKLGANKYFGDDNVEVEAQFEQGNKFVTRGADMTDVMYNAGLGLKTKFTEDTSVSLSTDYERNNDGDFQGVNGQLTFRMQF